MKTNTKAQMIDKVIVEYDQYNYARLINIKEAELILAKIGNWCQLLGVTAFDIQQEWLLSDLYPPYREFQDKTLALRAEVPK